MYKEGNIAWKSVLNPEESAQWKKLTFKRKELIPLTKKEKKSYEQSKTCKICQKIQTQMH